MFSFAGSWSHCAAKGRGGSVIVSKSWTVAVLHLVLGAENEVSVSYNETLAGSYQKALPFLATSRRAPSLRATMPKNLRSPKRFWRNIQHKDGAITAPGLYALRFILAGRRDDATEFQVALAALGLSYSGHAADWLFVTLFVMATVFCSAGGGRA